MSLQKITFLLIFALVHSRSLAPTVRNLQARYDPQQDAIFVTWNGPQDNEGRTGKHLFVVIQFTFLDLQYQLQYRIVNREPPDNELHYKRVQVTEAKLELPNLQNGDEVEAVSYTHLTLPTNREV